MSGTMHLVRSFSSSHVRPKLYKATRSLCWLQVAAVIVIVMCIQWSNGANITCEFCENENFQIEIDACYVTKAITLAKDEPLYFSVNNTTLDNITSVLFTPSGQLQSNITDIPKEVFRIFPQLRKLEIRGAIQRIARDDFHSARNLQHLTLNNQLECIPSRVFKNASTLISITLSRNRIVRIDDNAFQGLNALEQLQLAKNQLTALTRLMFAGLTKLNYLNLRDNDLETIEDGTFALPSLSELILSKNRLKTLSDHIFNGAPILRLAIDNNALETIGNSMYNLVQMNRIIMYQNKIRDIDIIAFAKMPELNTLWLRDSGFKFGNQTLDQYQPTASKVNYLDISYNHLSDPDDFQKLQIFKQLKTLTVDDNDYTEFNMGNRTIHEALPDLETFHLSRNKWNCTWLKPILEQARIEHIRTVQSQCE